MVRYIIFGPTVKRIGVVDEIGVVEFNRDHEITGKLSYKMMITLWKNWLERTT